MTAPAYTPSKPGDSAVLERLARQAQEGVSMDDARELVLRAYMAGFAAGVGEYVSEPSTAVTNPWRAAAERHTAAKVASIGRAVDDYDASAEDRHETTVVPDVRSGWRWDCSCGDSGPGDGKTYHVWSSAEYDARQHEQQFAPAVEPVTDAAEVVGELDAKAREAAEL